MTNILEVNDLKTYFYTRAGVVRAVDGIDLTLARGKTLGIVGESGSGKSVTMMSMLGLIPKPPGKIVGGQALFDGQDLLTLSESKMRQIRGKRIAMIFQDPMTSLNPYLKISTQLTEVLLEHENISMKDATARALQVLKDVGIPDPKRRLEQYPHEFSGGMRQRVMIAMAIIGRPDLLIADEPTTALDVTVQAQILELLRKLQQEYHMAMILITHNLGVAAGMCDDIMVMYAGKVVERGTVSQIFYEHRHPYTLGLLRSIPKIEGEIGTLYSIPGLPPDPSRLPEGCAYAPRCGYAMSQCRTSVPLPKRSRGVGHEAFCHVEGALA